MFVLIRYMGKRDIIIAIDGHSSTGKSSFAKEIASRYGLIYVDTGALYRGVTLFALRNGLINEMGVENPEKLHNQLGNVNLKFGQAARGANSELYLNGENIEAQIRSLEVAGKVSIVAAQKPVRDFVDSILKEFGVTGGVVMDGRDIGTVVFPDADLKIFMTADPKVRAMRRYREMVTRGEDANFDEVLKNVVERDFMDENRENAPLRRATDAIFLDNSNMTEEDQMVWIEKIISEKWKSLKKN
ncbi:MAG: (d)CMP kinase [Bacteroidales bacterium]|nr:(d)CMP kinase [Bacteroidales bacterium]